MKTQYTYKEKVRITKGFFKDYYATIEKEIEPHKKYEVELLNTTPFLKETDKKQQVTPQQLRPLNTIEKIKEVLKK